MGAFPQGKEEKALKGPFYQILQATLFLRISVKRLETGTKRVIQGSTQTPHLHRAAVSANQEKGAPFTQIDP